MPGNMQPPKTCYPVEPPLPSTPARKQEHLSSLFRWFGPSSATTSPPKKLPLVHKNNTGCRRTLGRGNSQERPRRSFSAGRSRLVKVKPQDLLHDKVLIEKLQRELQEARDQLRDLNERDNEAASQRQLDKLNAIADDDDAADGKIGVETNSSLFEREEDDYDSGLEPHIRNGSASSRHHSHCLGIELSFDLPENLAAAAAAQSMLNGVCPKESAIPDVSLVEFLEGDDSLDRESTNETDPLTYIENVWDHLGEDTKELPFSSSSPRIDRPRSSNDPQRTTTKSKKKKKTNTSPPSEVVVIHESPNISPWSSSLLPSPATKSSPLVPSNADDRLALHLADMEVVVATYRSKQETADDLIASLFRDLDKARRRMHTLVSRNIALVKDQKIIKVSQRDRMVPKSSLYRACMYIAPFFYWRGTLDSYLAAIFLVWALLEMELLDLLKEVEGNEVHDDEEEENTPTRSDHKTHPKKKQKKCRLKETCETPKELPSPKPVDFSAPRL